MQRWRWRRNAVLGTVWPWPASGRTCSPLACGAICSRGLTRRGTPVPAARRPRPGGVRAGTDRLLRPPPVNRTPGRGSSARGRWHPAPGCSWPGSRLPARSPCSVPAGAPASRRPAPCWTARSSRTPPPLSRPCGRSSPCPRHPGKLRLGLFARTWGWWFAQARRIDVVRTGGLASHRSITSRGRQRGDGNGADRQREPTGSGASSVTGPSAPGRPAEVANVDCPPHG